ncbi:type I restriction enzyme HsdR N-terminal domain-containing protein [Membranihabitans marinus]|uniref:type I restriction enzyme HsdR N-terminal domain-containing protein n=1 Tax=Membranihabitans marinus TaxID=1227546 RepID=UPI001F16D975|nr:type I restriction enzyme HsdR N-terminal domain-containing protein [Membranihabitans marinus]
MNIDLSQFWPDLTINKGKIFDPIRKKWYVVQPEELVRQCMIQYITKFLKWNPQFIAIEKSIAIGTQIKRFDLVLYNIHHRPILLIECKAPDQHLNDKVLEQAIWYNYELAAPYLMLSNGQDHQLYQVDNANKTYEILEQWPTMTQNHK